MFHSFWLLQYSTVVATVKYDTVLLNVDNHCDNVLNLLTLNSLLTSFMDSLRRHPFNTSQSGYPDGLRFFLVDIYIEEVSRIGGVEVWTLIH